MKHEEVTPEIVQGIAERADAELQPGGQQRREQSEQEEPSPRRGLPPGDRRGKQVSAEEGDEPAERMRLTPRSQIAPERVAGGPGAGRHARRLLEIAEILRAEPERRRRGSADPVDEPTGVSGVERHDLRVAETVQKTLLKIGIPDRRFRHVRVHADVAGEIGVDPELLHVPARIRRVLQEVVEDRVEEADVADAGRRDLPVVPDGQDAQGGSQREAETASARRGFRREKNSEGREERRVHELLRLRAHEERRRREVPDESQPAEPSVADSDRCACEGQKQEEQRRRLRVERVQRRGIAHVGVDQDQQSRGHDLRGRPEVPAGPDEKAERREEQQGVDLAQDPDVEHPSREQAQADPARREGEQRFGSEIAAHVPARRHDRQLRDDVPVVLLLEALGGIPEARVAHDALAIAFVGESHDRRHEELQRQKRPGESDRGECQNPVESVSIGHRARRCILHR